MRFLFDKEFPSFHDSVLGLMKKHSKRHSIEVWGFPSGNIECDTYGFQTKYGTLLMGHHNDTKHKRWWIPINLDNFGYGIQIPIAFEMCIPKAANRHLSVHYATDANDDINILHKGKFTVGYGSVSMLEFFRYYRANPGGWPIISFDGREYLLLGKLNQRLLDNSFLDLISSLAEFAKYIPSFKNKYRS